MTKAKAKVAEGFEYLGGSARNYRNTATGEILSRRKYDELIKGINYEEKAAYNAAKNPELQLLRPARGRKSYLKSEGWTKETIIEHRKAAQKKKELAKAAEKRERQLSRKVERLVNKKVKVKKLTKQAIDYRVKAGRRGKRIAFNTYDELLQLISEAKATGAIGIYGVGMVGVDVNTAEIRPITVYTMRSIKMEIDEDDFDSRMGDIEIEYSYLVKAHYFVHFAISSEYINAKTKR